MTTSELEIWKQLNELPEVKAVFGGWCPGDRYYCIGNRVILTHPEDYDENGPCACDIWIPPLFDPVRPEGSLWYLSREIRENWTPSDKILFAIMKRPDLALAKAILSGKGKGRWCRQAILEGGEMLACPFCGGTNLGIGRGEWLQTYVYCGDCGCRGPWIYTQDKAFFTCTEYACEKTGWNNRAILSGKGKGRWWRDQ